MHDMIEFITNVAILVVGSMIVSMVAVWLTGQVGRLMERPVRWLVWYLGGSEDEER